MEQHHLKRSLRPQKVSFNCQHMKSYLQYEFIEAADSDAPSLLCLICNRKLANEAMKPSKRLQHTQTNHSGLKDKPFEFF